MMAQGISASGYRERYLVKRISRKNVVDKTEIANRLVHKTEVKTAISGNIIKKTEIAKKIASKTETKTAVGRGNSTLLKLKRELRNKAARIKIQDSNSFFSKQNT